MFQWPNVQMLEDDEGLKFTVTGTTALYYNLNGKSLFQCYLGVPTQLLQQRQSSCVGTMVTAELPHKSSTVTSV